MKKILLAASLVLAGNTLVSTMSPPIEVQAKSAFTKKDVDAIKKGKFVHAKGRIGTSKEKLIEKKVKKGGYYSGLNFIQKYDVDLTIVYTLSLYNISTSKVETFDTVQFITAEYDGKIDASIFKKYFKRAKKYDMPYQNIIAYKVGEKYLLYYKNYNSTQLQIFKNENALKRFHSNAG